MQTKPRARLGILRAALLHIIFKFRKCETPNYFRYASLTTFWLRAMKSLRALPLRRPLARRAKLLENLILGSELLDFRLVGSMSGFLGLTYSRLGILGSLLLLISGILGLACLDYFRISLCNYSLWLHFSFLSLKNLALISR